MISRSFLDIQTVKLAFLKLITNLESLILKIYFEAAHFCLNAKPKSVQLAHYQSKKKKKKKHHLNKVTTFNVTTKSLTAKYHKLKTSNAMWLCYLRFIRVYSFPSPKRLRPQLLTAALLSWAGHSLSLSLIPFTDSCED